jgi:K+-transporting ATPase KdpF subunit
VRHGSDWVLCRFCRDDRVLRSHFNEESAAVTIWYVIAGILAVGLLVYLGLVLLNPELFS